MPHDWVPTQFKSEPLRSSPNLTRWECLICGKLVTYSDRQIPMPDSLVWVPDITSKLTCEEYQVWRVQNQ